jgi:hypothetical protein
MIEILLAHELDPKALLPRFHASGKTGNSPVTTSTPRPDRRTSRHRKTPFHRGNTGNGRSDANPKICAGCIRRPPRRVPGTKVDLKTGKATPAGQLAVKGVTDIA